MGRDAASSEHRDEILGVIATGTACCKSSISQNNRSERTEYSAMGRLALSKRSGAIEGRPSAAYIAPKAAFIQSLLRLARGYWLLGRKKLVQLILFLLFLLSDRIDKILRLLHLFDNTPNKYSDTNHHYGNPYHWETSFGD